MVVSQTQSSQLATKILSSELDLHVNEQKSAYHTCHILSCKEHHYVQNIISLSLAVYNFNLS